MADAPVTVLMACPTVAASVDITSVGGIAIVGSVSDTNDLLSQTAELKPDIVLLDVEESVPDAFELTKRIALELPASAVIIISENEEPDNLRRAMLAGAEEYIIKPADLDTVVTAINNVISVRRERAQVQAAEAPPDEAPAGHVTAVIAGKGGLGKTTVAVNLAMALLQGTEKRVALASFEVSDAAVLLKLSPAHCLTELTPVAAELDPELVEGYGTEHDSGLTLFGSNVRKFTEHQPIVPPFLGIAIIDILRGSRDYIVVDTPAITTQEDIEFLEHCDDVVVITSSQDLLALRNTKLLLEKLSEAVLSKVKLVVNRADRSDMIQPDQIEKTLGFPIAAILRNDFKMATAAINVGVPYMVQNSGSPLGQDMTRLAHKISGVILAAEPEKRKRFSLFS